MTIEPQILEELSALLDGELGQPRQEQLLAAMEKDPQLAQQFRQLQAVRDAVRNLPAQAAPPGMAQNILSRLKVQTAPATPARRSLRPQLAAAAVLIAAITLGWSLYFRQTEPSPEAKKDAQPVELAKVDRRLEEPASPTVPPPALGLNKDVEGHGGPGGLITGLRMDDYVPSSAGSVINEVTIDSDQPAETAQAVNTIFRRLPGNPDVKQSQLAGNKLQLQIEVAITDEQKDKTLADLKGLASQQRVAQRQSVEGVVLATRGLSPAGAPGSAAAASLPARPVLADMRYMRETNGPTLAAAPAAPATLPASAPIASRIAQDPRSKLAPAQNSTMNYLARQQFVVIVNGVNTAEMRLEAASRAAIQTQPIR